MCPECYEHWAIMGSSAQNTEERGTGDGNEGSGKVSTAPRPPVGPLHRLSWSRPSAVQFKTLARPVSAPVQQQTNITQQQQQQQPNMGTQMCVETIPQS